MGIIGVSGRMQSGKDTVAAIIQYLIWRDKVEKGQSTSIHLTFDDFKRTSVGVNTTGWEIRKFADKLKDITCMLLGCTREQLEDKDFKEKELGEEWWYYKHNIEGKILSIAEFDRINALNMNLLISHYTLVKPTPRLLMQFVGTECGRQIIHPNVWVNALMSNYTLITEIISRNTKSIGFGKYEIIGHGEYSGKIISTPTFKYGLPSPIFPNWIITDVRFPNEAQAIKDREGILIRVNRPDFIKNALTGEEFPVKVHRQEHESETALDNYKFDYEIQNDGTIAELIDKVEVILKQEKII